MATDRQDLFASLLREHYDSLIRDSLYSPTPTIVPFNTEYETSVQISIAELSKPKIFVEPSQL